MRSGTRSNTIAALVSRIRDVILLGMLTCLVLFQQSPFTIALCHHGTVPSVFLVNIASTQDHKNGIQCPYCTSREGTSKRSCCRHPSAAPLEAKAAAVQCNSFRSPSRPCCTVVAKVSVDSWTVADELVRKYDAAWTDFDCSSDVSLNQNVSYEWPAPTHRFRVFDRVLAYSHFLI